LRFQPKITSLTSFYTHCKSMMHDCAAEESIDEIVEHIKNSHMLFITAGMGGGSLSIWNTLFPLPEVFNSLSNKVWQRHYCAVSP
ncbi:MAG: hypothetical protein ACEY3F_05875, partial [Wolbachia sp.]